MAKCVHGATGCVHMVHTVHMVHMGMDMGMHMGMDMASGMLWVGRKVQRVQRSRWEVGGRWEDAVRRCSAKMQCERWCGVVPVGAAIVPA